jgi:hypothetical protein
VLDRTLPDETRADFGAGGYAYDAQDDALRSLSVLDLLAALRRIEMPTWFINGQFDQLRINERLFASLVPHAELIVVPRTATSSRRCARACSTPCSTSPSRRWRPRHPPVQGVEGPAVRSRGS